MVSAFLQGFSIGGGLILAIGSQNAIHVDYCKRLLDCARQQGLEVTFHRAFDATPGWRASLDTLITLGVDRVLIGC